MTKRKKRNLKFLYACPHCDQTYTTEKQAVGCAKNVADHFKAGDIVRHHGSVWLITNMKHNAATLEKIPSYRLAYGYQGHRDRQPKWHWTPVATFCGSEMKLIEKDEAKKQLKLRTKQAEAAQQFMNLFGGKDVGG